jgi:hypothetical protein
MIPTIEYVPEQWFFVPRKKVKKGEKWIYHVHCEGARFHILHWFKTDKGAICRCSEPDCIYNKPEAE